jgi:hypothetical protein
MSNLTCRKKYYCTSRGKWSFVVVGKRSIRFIQERWDSEKTRGRADSDSALWLLPVETLAIAKQGSWKFTAVFKEQ